MTSGIAEPKRVYLKHHHQHLNRLQKEGDEDSPWISGEELKTDGSSDDEEKGGAKPKQLRKLRKQTCKILKKEAENMSCQSSKLLTSKEQHQFDSKTSSFTKAECSAPSAAIKIPRIHRQAPIKTSSVEEKVGRSQSLTESLNLENRWRPKRGSLKLPSLTAESTTDGDSSNSHFEDGDKFYKEMLAKVGRLKENSRFEKLVHQTEEQTERKKILKKIRSTIEAIETNQAETNSLLRTMRQERHRAQEHNTMWMTSDRGGLSTGNPTVWQMCDTNPQLFLDMLRFEENSHISADQEEEEVEEAHRNADFENSLNEVPPGKQHDERQENERGGREEGTVETGQNFVQRNIELAAKAMTSFPLTDDEKQKLDDLLKDIADDEENEAAVLTGPSLRLPERLPSLLPSLSTPETVENVTEEDDQNVVTNGFCMSDEDKQRIDEINVELEKFEESQLLRLNDSSRNGDDFWRNLLLDQSLKEIDAKLENLKLKDINDDEPSHSFTDQ